MNIVNMVPCKEEKERDLTNSYDENHYTNGKINYHWEHKNATKKYIAQLLRTDFGRSVDVTTAIQLVLLNRSTGTQPSR